MTRLLTYSLLAIVLSSCGSTITKKNMQVSTPAPVEKKKFHSRRVPGLSPTVMRCAKNAELFFTGFDMEVGYFGADYNKVVGVVGECKQNAKHINSTETAVLNRLLGVSLRFLGRKEEALAVFKETIDLAPNIGTSFESYAYFQLADIYFSEGKIDMAKQTVAELDVAMEKYNAKKPKVTWKDAPHMTGLRGKLAQENRELSLAKMYFEKVLLSVSRNSFVDMGARYLDNLDFQTTLATNHYTRLLLVYEALNAEENTAVNSQKINLLKEFLESSAYKPLKYYDYPPIVRVPNAKKVTCDIVIDVLKNGKPSEAKSIACTDSRFIERAKDRLKYLLYKPKTDANGNYVITSDVVHSERFN